MTNKLSTETPREVGVFHTNEFIPYISQIGLVHPGQAKILFSQGLSSTELDTNPILQSILLAGRGRIATLEGDFHEASRLFDQALKAAQSEWQREATKSTADAFAYVKYEYAGFYNLFHSKSQSLDLYSQALQLSQSKRLCSILKYQIERLRLELGDISNPDKLIRMVSNFKSDNMLVMHAIGLNKLGMLMARWNRIEESESYFKSALEIARENNLQYIKWMVENALGLILFKKDKNKNSIKHFEKIVEDVESHYLKSLIIKNLALRYLQENQPEKALQLAKDGLEYTQVHNVLTNLPNYYSFIGELISKHTDKPEEAYSYYKMGYEESLRQKEAGIPLEGPRLAAVTRFVEYLDNHSVTDLSKQVSSQYFEWALDKSWVRIQDLFHYNLFVYHFIHTGIGQTTFKHLKMNSNTFYSLSKRMRDNRGISFPDFRDEDLNLPPNLYLDPLQRYVQLHRDKSFKEISAQFKREVYEFLYKANGYNKVKLSESLGLSYSVVINETKELTTPLALDTRKQLSANT